MGGRPNTGVVAGRAPGDVPGWPLPHTCRVAVRDTSLRHAAGVRVRFADRVATLRVPVFLKPSNTPPTSSVRISTLRWRRGTLVSGSAAHSEYLCGPRFRPLRDPRRKYHRPTRAARPAVFQRRNTCRRKRPSRPPASACVNDEARRLRRHVSRDVCGVRCRAPGLNCAGYARTRRARRTRASARPPVTPGCYALRPPEAGALFPFSRQEGKGAAERKKPGRKG